MLRPINTFLIAAIIDLPVVVRAADPPPLTRAEVRAQLIEAELSGQLPLSNTRYPEPAHNPAVAYVARKASSEMSCGAAMSTNSATSNSPARNASDATPTVDSTYLGH